MKRILVLAAALFSGCSETEKAPHTDVAGELGLAAPPQAVLAPPVAAPDPAIAEMDRLLGLLGSDDAGTRGSAEDALVGFGEFALSRLDALATAADPEVAARAGSAARRIRLGEALWLADLVEGQWRKASENRRNEVQPVDHLLATLRQDLAPVLSDPKAYQRLLDELYFAEKHMVDPDRQARISAVLDAHPDVADQLAALMAEVEKDPDFNDIRHRRAVAEEARITVLGLRSANKDVVYAALRSCGELRSRKAVLILPALIEVARTHADQEVRGIARGSLLGMLAEGTDWAWGGVKSVWPGPMPHVSRLAAEARSLVPWLMEVVASTSPGARAWALRTVGHLGDLSVVPAVLRAFREDRAVRSEAFRALVTLGAPEAHEALLDVLRHPDDPALIHALHASAWLRPEDAHDPVAALFDTLSGPDEFHAASIALCALARPDDLPRIVRIVEGWTEKTGAIEMTPGFGAILRLHPADSDDRRRIAARCETLLKADSGSVRLAAACVLESFDQRSGIRAWGSLLEERVMTEGALQVPVSWSAIGALERLTGQSFRGLIGQQTRAWKNWWAEHRGEYEEK